MSKDRWNCFEDAEHFYTEEGYEVRERREDRIVLRRESESGNSLYDLFVVIWKSRHDGYIYSEAY